MELISAPNGYVLYDTTNRGFLVNRATLEHGRTPDIAEAMIHLSEDRAKGYAVSMIDRFLVNNPSINPLSFQNRLIIIPVSITSNHGSIPIKYVPPQKKSGYGIYITIAYRKALTPEVRYSPTYKGWWKKAGGDSLKDVRCPHPSTIEQDPQLGEVWTQYLFAERWLKVIEPELKRNGYQSDFKYTIEIKDV